jgi:potassium channel subfamily K
MTVCSTIVSIFTNITLVADVIMTPDFGKSGEFRFSLAFPKRKNVTHCQNVFPHLPSSKLIGSGLTRKQSALVVVVILLLGYIAFGAMINSFLGHLSFIDALYFTVVTIETIGFGDIKPESTGSRIFICIYATFGILNLALLVGMMRDTVLEAVEFSYRKRLRAVRLKRRAARVRRRIAGRWREAVEWRLRAVGAPIWVKDGAKSNTWFAEIKEIAAIVVNWVRQPWAGNADRYRRGLGYGIGQHPHGMHLGLEALTHAQLEAAAMEAGAPLDTLLPPGFKSCAEAAETNSQSESGSERGRQGGRRGDGIVAGITGLWRDRRTRDERDGVDDAEGQPTLTHTRMGRMVAMIRRFALTLYGSTGRPHGNEHGVGHEHEQGQEHSVGVVPRATPNVSRIFLQGLNNATSESEKVNPDDNKVELAGEGRDNTETPTLDNGEDGGSRTPLPLQPVPGANTPRPPFTRTSTLLVSDQHDTYQFEMENEEWKAFIGRVTVAWILFIVFWTIGSGIFMKTEGWSYGTAMYFCESWLRCVWGGSAHFC